MSARWRLRRRRARERSRRRRALGLAVLALALVALGVLAYLYLTRKTWWEIALEPAPASCRCVAFRLDDIQDFFTREAQVDLIKIFLEEGVPLTMAVIGGSLHDDRELIEFLQPAASAGIEAANHGWVHSDHTALTGREQRDSIVRTNDRIRALFGVEARTFVPPENPFNDQTLSIMKEFGLTHLSGSVFLKADQPPFPLKNGDMIFHFPQTAFVSDVDTPTGVWRLVPPEQILEMIRDSVGQHGFAVVVTHPIAYYDRTEAGYVYHRALLEPLRELLREVKRGFKVVRIDEIDRQGWIPKDVPRTLRLREHAVSWRGGATRLATGAEVAIEVRGERLVLERRGGAWPAPFVLLLPEAITPGAPTILAAGESLPTLRWFNPEAATWIVYADPPPWARSLQVMPQGGPAPGR
ncbi:MAG: polysaccharide deacetylase family protein [Candidatus Rokubacteria bacterium]|nr:polysaccharide deacetylase family protein [Candidatus Rokubacteria bacterium]